MVRPSAPLAARRRVAAFFSKAVLLSRPVRGSFSSNACKRALIWPISRRWTRTTAALCAFVSEMASATMEEKVRLSIGPLSR